MIDQYRHKAYQRLQVKSVVMDGVNGFYHVDWCGKELKSGESAIVIWKRPTTAHYFSRAMVYCGKCLKRLCNTGNGLPTWYHGILAADLPCGGWVIPVMDGLDHTLEEKLRGIGRTLYPDYMPIESPRLFGLAVSGGPMMEHYRSCRKVVA